jgi:DNA replication protein DnaC
MSQPNEHHAPKTQTELQSGISRLANDLYVPALARWAEIVSPKASFAENLYALLSEQHVATFEKRVARKLKTAGFPIVKTMDMLALDNEHYPNISLDEARELTSCSFIDEAADVCAIGPAGHGKTHLALAIGYEAIKRGYTVKYRRACDMINEMREAGTNQNLLDYARMMTRCALLILDEVGYVSYDEASANYLFQIIGARYETKSTIYVSNHRFSEWPKFIGGTALAAAIISRIAHRASVLDMGGGIAWRLEHARSRRVRQHPNPKPPEPIPPIAP